MSSKLNLPNKITLFRVICVVILYVIFLLDYFLYFKTGIFEGIIINGEETYSWTRIVIFAIFVIATISDKVDGDIARKYNLITNLGKFLDPIADKLLYNSLFIYFAVVGDVLFIVPLIYIFRDTIVDGIRMMAAKKQVVIPASILGKAKTVSQVVAMAAIFVFVPLSAISNIFNILTIILVSASVVLSVVSGVEYLVKNIKVLED